VQMMDARLRSISGEILGRQQNDEKCSALHEKMKCWINIKISYSILLGIWPVLRGAQDVGEGGNTQHNLTKSIAGWCKES
jgi:hypothetical protein